MSWKPIEFRNGSEGVADAAMFGQMCRDSPKFVADCLCQYQMWRKGEGEYKEYETDPTRNAPPPMCPKALTIVEEAAIQMLLEYGKVKPRGQK